MSDFGLDSLRDFQSSVNKNTDDETKKDTKPAESSRTNIDVEGIANESVRQLLLGPCAAAVTTDILGFIERGEREALRGYIQCLSRVSLPKEAFAILENAYAFAGEVVPSVYKELFKVTDDP